MPREFIDTGLDHAVQEYLGGAGLKRAAQAGGISYQVLRRHLIENGLQRDITGYTKAVASKKRAASRLDLPESEIVALYNSGWTEKWIAEKYGCSRSPIKRILVSNGVKIRTMQESVKLGFAAMPADKRAAFTESAHRRVRGRKQSFEHRCRIAATREKLQSNVSPAEMIIAEWLAQSGFDVITQKAIGPYNVDLAIGSVAVEIFGGGWHGYGRHKKRTAERYSYLFNQGWSCVIIWVDQRTCPLSRSVADYLVSHLNGPGSDPSSAGKYWVIRGDGKQFAAGSTDVNQITVVPSLS